MENLKIQIEQTLVEIETLAKKARFENVNMDATAREIAGCADRLKDLSYRLALAEVQTVGVR